MTEEAKEVAKSIAESLGEAWDATEEETEEVAEAAPAEEAEEETEQEEAVEAAEEGADDSEATEEEAEPEAPIDAPASLSEEEKAVFSELPDELQEFIRRREGERDSAFQKKTQEIASIKAAFEPYKDMLAINGVSEAEAIQRLLNAQAYLQRDPLAAIKQLAQNFGVLDKLVPAKTEESDEYLDPQVAKLQKELEALKAQQSDSSTAAQRQQQEQIVQEIARFKSATDESGNPKHPHFEAVKHLMAPLVQQGKSLEEAYAEVIYVVPEVREAEIAKAREDADKQRRSSTKKKVVKAKKSATHVKGSTRQETPDKPTSLRGMLESQFDELATGG